MSLASVQACKPQKIDRKIHPHRLISFVLWTIAGIYTNRWSQFIQINYIYLQEQRCSGSKVTPWNERF